MTDWLISAAAAAACLLVFYIIGMILPPERGDGARSAAETIIAGFILYLGAFEIVCAVSTWVGISLTLFVYIWGGILAAGIAFSLVKYFGTWIRNLGWDFKHFKFRPSVLFMFAAVIAAGAFSLISPFMTDGQLTISRMATDVYHDTLSTFDPETGAALSRIEPFSLLDRWPVSLEFIVRLTGLKPVTVAHVSAEVLTVILSSMVIWRIFMRIFSGDTVKAAAAGIFTLVVEIFSRTEYTPAGLLFGAGWSGEAVFANVLLPSVILMVLIMQDIPDKPQPFALLFICGIGAAATCPAGILAEPLLVAACMIPETIVSKRPGHLLRLLICLVPAAAGLIFCLLIPSIPL